MNLPCDSVPLDELPAGFDYYALGHIHEKRIFNKGNAKVAYPGALFPCNFSEIEKEKGTGSFFIVSVGDGLELQEVPVRLKEVKTMDFNADNENPQSLKEKILDKARAEDFKDKIVTLRISGTLASGRPSELDLVTLKKSFHEAGAFSFLRNTSKLLSKEFELVSKLDHFELESLDIKKLEKEIIAEMIKQQVIVSDDETKVLEFMDCFDKEKVEGETNDVFASRLSKEVIEKLNLNFVGDNFN